jgi:hypothetical protein
MVSREVKGGQKSQGLRRSRRIHNEHGEESESDVTGTGFVWFKGDARTTYSYLVNTVGGYLLAFPDSSLVMK